MSGATAETPQESMKRVAEGSATRLKVQCELNQVGGSAAPKEAAVWEHACLVAEADEAGCTKCATVLLAVLADEPSEDYRSAASADTLLTSLKDATPDDSSALTHGVITTGSSWRTALRSFILIARTLSQEEAHARLDATRTSPVRPFSLGSGGAAAPGRDATTVSANVVVQPTKNSDERKDDRFNSMGSWLNKHEPRAAHRAHTYAPSREACLEYPEYKVSGSMPTIPKLDRLTTLGGAQDVLDGRDCPLASLKRSLTAFQKAHAVPCPEGVNARPEDGTERLSVKVADGSAALGYRYESRPPAVSATAVDEAIEQVDGALHPLSREQKALYAKKAWNELITAMGATEQVGRPLTGALKKAWARPWLEEANAVGRTVFAKEGKRAREEAAAAARKAAKVGSPPKGGKGAGKGGKGGQSKPTCASWRASGKCANHDADQCPNHHPKGWKDSGEP